MGSKNAPEPPLGELAQDALEHFEKLIDLQIRLLKSEVREELAKVGSAAASVGAGAGLLAVGGILSTQMLVHLLHRQSRLPLWACYGLVAAGLGGAGVGLLARARNTAARVQLPALPQTAEGLKENVSWLKDQVTPS